MGTAQRDTSGHVYLDAKARLHANRSDLSAIITQQAVILLL